MKLLKNKNHRTLIITLIILLLMGVLSQGQNGALSGALNLVPLGFFELTASARSIPDSAATEDEASALQKENAELREQLADHLDVTRENERLREYFGLAKRNTDKKLKPARVIARDPDDDFYSFTLNVGEEDGVSVGDPVITKNGLVGIVKYADSHTCAVTTVLSPELAVSAEDKHTRDSGAVKGAAELSGKNQTEFKLFSEDSKIKSGDIVATSGEGGLCPKNLMIGRVIKTGFDSFDSTRCAVVELYEDIKSISDAAVIVDFAGKGEVKNARR